jgi:hypothetical protein
MSIEQQETETKVMRIVYFKGHKNQPESAMITKIYKHYETFSSLFRLEFECSSRTILNLYNLHAVRGCLDINNQLILQTSMSGPHHYFGFINASNLHTIRFDKQSNLPIFQKHHQYNCLPQQRVQKTPFRMALPESKTIVITDYQWIKGNSQNKLQQSRSDDSLFLNPGILKLNQTILHFNVIYDAYKYNLSSFRAQLVPNNKPFSFDQNLIKLYPQNKLRVITYFYGNKYVPDYLMQGNGLFLEKHSFVQSITPLDAKYCGGFVILGRENRINKELILIGIYIPFGFTLLLEPFCIHGDATLTGMFMMAMTGNHVEMNSADTVFLKNTITGQNVHVATVSPVVNVINMPLSTHLERQLLLTSNKMCLYQIITTDNKLKQEIKTNARHHLGLLASSFWKPVIWTGTKHIGWDKTLGNFLPRLSI